MAIVNITNMEKIIENMKEIDIKKINKHIFKIEKFLIKEVIEGKEEVMIDHRANKYKLINFKIIDNKKDNAEIINIKIYKNNKKQAIKSIILTLMPNNPKLKIKNNQNNLYKNNNQLN